MVGVLKKYIIGEGMKKIPLTPFRNGGMGL